MCITVKSQVFEVQSLVSVALVLPRAVRVHETYTTLFPGNDSGHRLPKKNDKKKEFIASKLHGTTADRCDSSARTGLG